jgi:hypothetical protein
MFRLDFIRVLQVRKYRQGELVFFVVFIVQFMIVHRHYRSIIAIEPVLAFPHPWAMVVILGGEVACGDPGSFYGRLGKTGKSRDNYARLLREKKQLE